MVAYARAYLFEDGEDAEEVKRRLSMANPGTVVQTVRPGTARNEALIEMLAAQTFTAEPSRALLAKKPEIDLLLRLAGTTQISRAIKECGTKAGQDFLAINAGTSELVSPAGFESREVQRRGLSEAELDRIERAALLDAQRG